MKKIKSISLLFFLLCVPGILLTGCDKKSPRQVAEKYLDAFHDQDYEKAMKYATPDSRRLLNMFITLAGMTPDSLKVKLRFDVVGEKIKGDTAYVEYRLEGSSKTQSLTLLRTEGDWKVSATKESINEIQGGEAIDSGAVQTDTNDTEPGPADSLRQDVIP